MATIRPKDLAAAGSVSGTDAFVVDNGAVVSKATPAQIVDAAIPLASQAEAEAGTDNAKRVTPLRVLQAIEVNMAGADPNLRTDLVSTASGKGIDLIGGLRNTLDGSVSLLARSASTAAALVTLASTNTSLKGVTGDSHTVEISPFVNTPGLLLNLNGAELRNVNATSLATNAVVQSPLSVGMAAFQMHDELTFRAATCSAGSKVVTVTGHGADFAVGDMVQMIGATNALITTYHSHRNVLHARVMAKSGDNLTLDRAPSRYLIADTPTIAPVKGVLAAEVQTSFPGLNWFIGYKPTVVNGTLVSNIGETLSGYSACVGGTFQDLALSGRKAISVNAQQDCLWENIDIGDSWMRIAELAMNSNGTTVRHVRGTLSSWVGKLGGADDTGTFALSIGENSTNCTFDDFVCSTGSNDYGSGSTAMALGWGRNNKGINLEIAFPAHTGTGIGIVSQSTAGLSSDNCGYENCAFDMPACLQYFAITDAGAGVNQGYMRGVKFTGAATTRGGILNGANITGFDFTGVHIPAQGARATGTATFSGNAANNDTLSLAGTTYTFKTALTPAANEVLIGASASASIDNLVAAINAASGGGTTYGAATTQNANAYATKTSSSLMTATARVVGTSGNSLALAKSSANIAVSGAVLAGGVAAAPVLFNTSMAGNRFTDSYIGDGWSGLTQAILDQNAFGNCTSAASLRLEVLANTCSSRAVTTKTAITSDGSPNIMTIQPGDLAQFDGVHIRGEYVAAGGGTNARHVIISVCGDGQGVTWTTVLDATETVNGQLFEVECRIRAFGNGTLLCSAKKTGSSTPQLAPVSVNSGVNLLGVGLMVKIECYTVTSGSMNQNWLLFAPQKAGFHSVKVFGDG